jgi:hypothetical protein
MAMLCQKLELPVKLANGNICILIFSHLFVWASSVSLILIRISYISSFIMEFFFLFH